MGTSVLMGKSAKSEDKELASEILAGKMKNAWEVEDRPNRADQRPPQMRPLHRFVHTSAYCSNYDRIFRKGSGKNERNLQG